jgi:hypothetical protein
MSIPSSIGLPLELKLGEVDFSLPADARSYQVNVQPSNVSTVSQTGISVISAVSSPPTTTPQFTSQTIYFDLPAGSSPSTFIDNRFTTISFKANLAVTAAFVGASAQTGFQRSGGYSWFDRMYITAQNGNIVEDITEYGLVNDLMVATQLNTATRDTLASMYGFLSGTNNEAQGHQWSSIAQATAIAAAGETFSYSMPLVSSLIGTSADRFFNIGRTNKLQVALQTCSELPISIQNPVTALISAGTFTITLSDFVIQCQYVDIGPTALAMIDATLPDRKAYIHGTTYKTSSITMPSASGSQSLLAGIRGSSIKSLFVRFQEGGATPNTVANGANGKYDSKNPMINSINFNVGGQRLPNNPINPLLHPSRAFRALQMASGSYNNSQFQSCMIPAQYMKLSAGGTAATVAAPLGTTQAFQYNLGSLNTALCQFIYGEDLEVVARRGLMSGMNCNSAPVFVELNIATAPTNSQVVYVHALSDVVYIHDVATGDVQVRL